MRTLVTIGLVLVALAGCSSSVPTAPPSEEGPATEIPREGREGYRVVAESYATDCEGFTFVAFVPTTAVASELPPDYPASGKTVNNPHLAAVRCASIELEGTAVSDVGLAVSGTLLESGEFYRWEFFIDEPAPLLLPRLQALGWPAFAAKVDGDPAGISVSADGITYTTTTIAGQPQRINDPDSTTVHFLGADGVARMLDEGLNTGTPNEKITAAVLQASGGTWGRIAGRTADPLVGATNPVHSDWPMTFYVPST